jgi:hypothetical protein
MYCGDYEMGIDIYIYKIVWWNNNDIKEKWKKSIKIWEYNNI